MLAGNVVVTVSICFLVTLSKLLSVYILHRQTANFDNHGDTRVRSHCGDEYG